MVWGRSGLGCPPLLTHVLPASQGPLMDIMNQTEEDIRDATQRKMALEEALEQVCGWAKPGLRHQELPSCLLWPGLGPELGCRPC